MWGPVNGERAAAHTKTRPDKPTLFFFLVAFLFFPLTHFPFLFLLYPIPYPHLVAFSSTKLCETGPGFSSWTVEWVLARSQASWDTCLIPVPSFCRLYSGLLALQLKPKHFGLWNQRHSNDLACMIFEDHYITRTFKKRQMKQAVDCETLSSCCTVTEHRQYF